MRSQTVQAPRADVGTSTSQARLQRPDHSHKSICGVIFDGVARKHIKMRRWPRQVTSKEGQLFAISRCGDFSPRDFVTRSIVPRPSSTYVLTVIWLGLG